GPRIAPSSTVRLCSLLVVSVVTLATPALASAGSRSGGAARLTPRRLLEHLRRARRGHGLVRLTPGLHQLNIRGVDARLDIADDTVASLKVKPRLIEFDFGETPIYIPGALGLMTATSSGHGIRDSFARMLNLVVDPTFKVYKVEIRVASDGSVSPTVSGTV